MGRRRRRSRCRASLGGRSGSRRRWQRSCRRCAQSSKGRATGCLASVIRTPRWHHFRTPLFLEGARVCHTNQPAVPEGAAGAGRNARKAPCSLPIVCCNERGSTYISCSALDRAHSMFYFCRRYEAGAHAAAAPWGRRDCADRPQRAPVEALVSLRCAKLRCNDLIRSDLIRSDLFQSDPI